MGTITLRDFPDQILHFELPDVIDDEIIIDVYDNVTGLTITNCVSNEGFSTNVENNNKDLTEFALEIGKYDIEIHTESDGILLKTIELEDPDILLIFSKKEFEYELQRIDAENNQIVNTNSENLADTFVSTDEIRIKFNQLNGCNLENDGYSFDDIVWEVKGVTENDGNPKSEINDEVLEFNPSPINRPTSGSRNPNEAIKYLVTATILGLKTVFELEQDEKDILRQEYIDYNITWKPTREEVFFENDGWNTGNYNCIATRANNRFSEIWDELQGNYQSLCSQNNISTDGLTFNSCYRNPQRNRAVGSVLINSNHTIGHAMDIGIINPKTSLKWILLNKAAEQIENVNGICERGPRQVVCGDKNQSHVHLAWPINN